MSTPPTIASQSPTKWRALIGPIQKLLNRFPWLLPVSSFAAGWIGFIMVQRGADLAQLIALLALVGWPWLLIEPVVRRRLEKRKAGMGNLVVNFISQSLQQEVLFFALPFIIGATQLDFGQITFTALAGAAALLSTIDPLYERHIATRAANRLLFHAYCSWIAALVVLPMVLQFPVERAMPISIIAVAISLVLTLPLSLPSLRTRRKKVAWIVSLFLVPVLLWGSRGQIPAAGLGVTNAVITQSIDDLTPGAPVRRLSAADLSRGVIAFAAIRAPRGLAQTVVFQWRHGGDSERIVEEIHGGGNDEGWRTYSRKQVFPEDPRGRWTVDILTPQRQLLKRMTFFVS